MKYSMNMPKVIRVVRDRCDEMLSDIMVNEDIVAKKLLKLKLNKASGWDGFVPRLLIETATVLSSPLSTEFNKSFKDGIVSSELKKANTSAIFNKGSSCSAGNQSPVSFTSHVC